MAFAENLKEILELKDIQVKELSQGTGISKNTIDNYLSGQKSLPNAENAVKIARFTGTTVEFLVLGNDKDLSSHNSEITTLVHELKYLKKSDFEAIKTLIHSLSKI